MPVWNWVYPLIMLFAISAGLLVRRWTQPALPLARLQKLGLAFGAFCGAMVFAKLPYLFLDWDRFVSGQSWFDNGKTITLGLMGGYFGVEGMKWAMRIPFKTGDGFAVPVAVSIAIGRLSCFAAGCCYGVPTNLPWGIRFHDAFYRHPTQLYEFLFHVTMAVCMWHMLKYKMLTGNLIKFYFVSYYCYRFLTEFIRPEPRILYGLTFYQCASLVGIALFGTLWYVEQKKMTAFRQHEARIREALESR